MKTVKAHFESIKDENLRAKALANLKRSRWAKESSEQYAPDLATALSKGFLWLHSKEGHSFWLEIATNADKIEVK